MSGGNFDEELIIKGGRITPRGPLSLNGNTIVEIYIWVLQMRDDGSGAAQAWELKGAGVVKRVKGQPDSTFWEAAGVTGPASEEGSPQGEFLPGPAIGMGVIVATTPGEPPTTTVSTWTDTIALKADEAAGS